MLSIKLISLSLILIICIYLGNFKAKTFENRVVELNKFQNSLIMFKSKIEFTQEPIKNIFEDISKVIYENSENIFQNTIIEDKDISISWNNSIKNINNYFTNEDKEIIKMLGKMLWKTDVKGQVNEIDLCISLIERQIKKADTEKEKNYKLYKTMGIILGLGICVILVWLILIIYISFIIERKKKWI